MHNMDKRAKILFQYFISPCNIVNAAIGQNANDIKYVQMRQNTNAKNVHQFKY